MKYLVVLLLAVLSACAYITGSNNTISIERTVSGSIDAQVSDVNKDKDKK